MSSSPVGEFKLVAADLAKIIGEGALTPDRVASLQRAHNIKNSVVFAGTPSVVACEEGAVGPTTIVDTKSRTVVEVNHADQTVIGPSAEPVPAGLFDPALEGARSALVAALTGHAAAVYSRATSYGFEVFSRGGELTVIASSHAINLRNLWTGQWRSRWTIAMTSASSATVTGVSEISTHYFENGNMQMTATKRHAAAIAFADVEAFAKAVTAEISSAEDGLQTGLESLFENMGFQTLKDIRRFLPISGKKMEWVLAAHRMTRTLRK